MVGSLSFDNSFALVIVLFVGRRHLYPAPPHPRMATNDLQQASLLSSPHSLQKRSAVALKAAGKSQGVIAIFSYMPRELTGTGRKAANRRFVLRSVVNFRPQNMLQDVGFKLFEHSLLAIPLAFSIKAPVRQVSAGPVCSMSGRRC